MSLPSERYWIFDLDGTLTEAIHDFEAIRATLGLPGGQPILESIEQRPPDEARRLLRRLDEIELGIAALARPMPGALELLSALARRHAYLGVLTRNSIPNALETLRRTRLLPYFEKASILGRESAAPKPDPEGISRLLHRWGAGPGEGVMVGNYLFDLLAGRAAGITTVLVDDTEASEWSEHADFTVRDLKSLLQLAEDSAELSAGT